MHSELRVAEQPGSVDAMAVVAAAQPRTVLVVSHTWVQHSAHYLVLTLRRSVANVVFVELPFAHAPDPRARLTEYRDGEEIRRWHAPLRTPPGVPGFVTDVARVWWWAARLRRRFDLAIAFDCLNTLSCLPLRRLGMVRQVAFCSVDFVPQRFANRLLNRVYLAVDRLGAERADVCWVGGRIGEGRRAVTGMAERRAAPEVLISAGSKVTVGTPPPADAPVLAFVGHLLEKQGLQLVIEALPEVLGVHPGARLRVIGDGPYEPELRALAERTGVAAAIDWLGRVDEQEQMLSALSRCSLGLAPYRPDPTSFSRYAEGGKIRDYLACGLPVVTTDVTTLAALVAEQSCGVIVDYDRGQLAAAVTGLLGDGRRWAHMRRNAFAAAAEYDWDTIFARVLSETLALTGYPTPAEEHHCAT